MPDNQIHNEKELLTLVAEGNEQAFKQLFEHFRNDVFLHALTYTKSPEYAEELVLDIFLKIWINRDKLPDILSFKNYLFILGRNQIISAMRKRLSEKTGLTTVETLEEEFLLPHRQLETKEMGVLVQKGIDTLSPQQRRVFTLSRMELKTYEEIAVEMGISKRTVNFHIVGALNALREFLRSETVLLGLSFLLAISRS